ncbi:arylsulfatase [Maribacter sp. 2307ULW6-5]|uniref:arylsulfatase n=1 Tax=Maribacter sp. 2307ULW6-5 TaxID=3386275 RepID=UPI0039BCB399
MKPKMTDALKITTLLVLLGLFSCQEGTTEHAGEGASQNPPNIILMLADDQGWGDLGHHGNTNIRTPHLDALAKNGVSFSHFFVQPVCSPTRAELLTGQFFTRLGVHGTSSGGERMDPTARTLAEILKKAGYKTAAYGKWHNGMQAPYHPNTRGFADFYGFASGHWGNYFSPLLEHNGRMVRGEGFLADDLTQRGLRFMERHKNAPFFLYLPFNTPHSPMQMPDRHWEEVSDREMTLLHGGTEKEDGQITKAALAMVENIDWNVGRIAQKLRELKLEERTIVIYLSDNGPSDWRWNGGMRGKKGSTDDGGVRTPFFIQWKNTLPAGKVVAEIGSALDVLPTLLELTGVPYDGEGTLDGNSLTPLLMEEGGHWPDRLLYQHWNGKTSVRTQRYRLDANGRLYDMGTDGGQTTDLAEKMPAVTDSLRRAKEQWLANTVPLTKATDNRPFTLGHPDHRFTQLPARDGVGHGNIVRSNRYPNNTFFTHWTSEKDSISWDIEVLQKGHYKTTLYYTLPKGQEGIGVHLRFGDGHISKTISEAHDPPLTGMEHDRTPRMESYVKDFKPVVLGTLFMEKGRQHLVLKTSKLQPQKKGLDVRLLLFERVSGDKDGP